MRPIIYTSAYSRVSKKSKRKMYWWHGLTTKIPMIRSLNLDNKMSENVQDIQNSPKIHHQSHVKLKSSITNRMKNTSSVKFQRSIVQGVSLSLLIYTTIESYTGSSKGAKNSEKSEIESIAYFYKDYIKLYVKNEKEQETLIQTIRIYNPDI